MAQKHKQELTSKDFKLRLLNGKKFEILVSDVVSKFNSVSGGEQEKRTITREWLRELMKTSLGVDDFERVFRECDVDAFTGKPIFLIVTG